MQIAILNNETATVTLHTLPAEVKTDEQIEEYVHGEIDISSNEDWFVAENIIIQDFRNK